MNRRRNKVYIYSIISLIAVFLGYIGRDNSPLIPSVLLANISNILIYIGGPGICLFFVFGVSENKGIRISCFSLVVINTILAIVSVWAHLYFVVDPQTAVYTRGSCFFIPYTIAGILLAIWIVLLLIENRKVDFVERIKIASLFFVELICVVIQIFVKDLKIVYIGCVFILEIYYAFLIETDGKFDKMTGTNSRRFYIRTIENIKADDEFTIMMFDINNLKYINDTFGHENGDKLIATVAEVIMKAVGGNGKVFRIGGDEFVVLLKYCTHNQAVKYQTSINQMLSVKQIDLGFEASTSSGIAVHEGSEDYSRTFRRADTEMYELKKQYHANNDQQ